MWPSSASAAPPAVTSLFPAGGQRGTTVEVAAAGTFDKWPVQVWASGPGVSAKAARDKGKLSVTVAADATPGVYWLRVYDDTGASGLRPFVVGTLPEVAEAEPNDEPTAPQTVACPAVVNGKLSKNGDVDCYAVRLKKGNTLVASLEAHHTLRSPMDGVLQVASADGFVLAQNNDYRGLDPQITFPAPADGTYLVRVFAFPATPDSGIRFSGGDTFVYRLTLTTGGFADFAIPLAVSRDAPGAVRLTGWNIPTAAKAVPIPAESDNTVSLTVSGTANPVAVRVEPHPCSDLTAGGPRQPLPLPFTATGCVAKPGVADSVPFTATKGKPVTVQIESRALDLPLTPVLQVLDAAGKQLARAEPAKLNADCELTFTPPADGTYRVEVRDLHGDGGPRFAYRLRVMPAEPDFELTVAGDRFALAPGKPLDVPVTVVPRNGFKGEIELKADGLPPGVTATVAKADAKAITLRLSAEKAGVSGPFRVVGRVKGESGAAHTARAAVAEFETTTADLWLTVSEKATVAPPAAKKKK